MRVGGMFPTETVTTYVSWVGVKRGGLEGSNRACGMQAMFAGVREG